MGPLRVLILLPRRFSVLSVSSWYMVFGAFITTEARRTLRVHQEESQIKTPSRTPSEFFRCIFLPVPIMPRLCHQTSDAPSPTILNKTSTNEIRAGRRRAPTLVFIPRSTTGLD